MTVYEKFVEIFSKIDLKNITYMDYQSDYARIDFHFNKVRIYFDLTNSDISLTIDNTRIENLDMFTYDQCRNLFDILEQIYEDFSDYVINKLLEL